MCVSVCVVCVCVCVCVGGGGGGVTQERFSNISNNRFFKRRHCQKTLSVIKSFTGDIKSMQCKLLQDIIASISLLIELTSSNLALTLLNPSKVIWHRLFLLNVSVVFVNVKKCSVQNRVDFIKP